MARLRGSATSNASGSRDDTRGSSRCSRRCATSSTTRVVLAIIASAERELRLDFRARLGGKGAVAVRFGALDERFHGHVPLEEIVDVWKDLTKAPNECGAFKQMYVYRHGLAHGRYFNKSGLHDATPEDAAVVVDELVTKIQAHTADFPQR